MLLSDPAQSVTSLVLAKNTRLGPSLDDLRLNPPREFRVSLNSDKPARGIHALDSTARRRSEQRHIGRTVEDHILVHLLDALRLVRMSAYLCVCSPIPRPQQVLTIFSSPKNSLPCSVRSMSQTEISQPWSLRPTFAPSARPMI